MQSPVGLEAERRMVAAIFHTVSERVSWISGTKRRFFFSVSAEETSSDAAVHQHGGEPEGL